MTDKRKHMSCEEFSACMADLIAAGEDIFAHPHVRRCKLHRALLEDLETIAKAARQLLPEVDPPDTLWDGIQAQLGLDLPGPIVSHPWQGCRVVFSLQVIENYNPHASPSATVQSQADPPIRMQIYGISRPPARREKRRR